MTSSKPEGQQEWTTLCRTRLLSATGEFDLESIQFLNLSNCGIEDISALESCVNLTRLDLGKNEISVLRPLKDIKALSSLNLSANRITNIDALGELENLVDLNLAGNLIGTFERVQCLKNISSLEKLRFLDSVRKLSNPICHHLSYEDQIISLFPNLITLDGMRLKGSGSELFRICKQLDEQIKNSRTEHKHAEFCPCGSCDDDERTFGPVEERVIPGAWLMPGYFSLPAPNTQEDYATIEFKETLEECKKLNNSAKNHIASMKT